MPTVSKCDLKVPKFHDFYTNHFHQFLSEIWTMPLPNPIFYANFGLGLAKTAFFIFFLPFPSFRPSLSLLALLRQLYTMVEAK